MEESVILRKYNMNQDFENNVVMKVKIQTRLSDLVPDGEPKTSKSEDGRTNGDFLLACCLPPREMLSIPRIKVDEATIQNTKTKKNFDDSQSTAEDPRVKLKLHQGGSNRLACLRRKSVASSTPTRSKILEQETARTRPILRKCSSLRETRQGRRREVEENKIVR